MSNGALNLLSASSGLGYFMYWNVGYIGTSQQAGLTDGSMDFAGVWRSPSNAVSGDEFLIIFTSPINIGTLVLIPGDTSIVDCYIATGTSNYYSSNRP